MSEAANQSVNYADAVCRVLKEVGLKFSEAKTNGGKKLTLPMPAENAPEIKIQMYMDEDGDTRVRSYLPYGIPREQTPHMLTVINNLNGRYRFVSFYLDSDGDICAEYDVRFCATGEALQQHVMKTLLLFLEIVDECLPDIEQGIREAAEITAEDNTFYIKTNLFEED